MKKKEIPKLEEVINLIQVFCLKHLDQKHFEAAKNLTQEIERSRKSTFTIEHPEIWAAAIIQIVINSGQLDNSHKVKVSDNNINKFFGTNKSTTELLKRKIRNILINTYVSEKPKMIKEESFLRYCESNILLMEEIPEYKPSSSINKPPNFLKYIVFYGTNRAIDIELKKIQYKNNRDNVLHLGFCEISIPSTHKIGNLERPSWFRRLLFEESPDNNFTILSNKKTEEQEFISLLQQRIGQSDEKDVLLFIHGFNVKFDEAMLRTAQLGFDLNFKGGVTAFSWPSSGYIGGYITDMDSARLSSDYLCSFIKLLIKDNVNKLNIIAHSMGNVVLTQALLQLKQEKNMSNITVNQIILAAPDIDKDIFIKQIMPSINGMARITLYASSKDKALLASKKIRNEYERLGEGGKNIVIVDGLESIDASRVDTSLLGHGYFAQTQSLLNDIHMVLLGIQPEKRILDVKNVIISGENKRYWVFRNS